MVQFHRLVIIVFFLVLTLSGQNAFDNKWGWVWNRYFAIVILFLAHKNFKDEGDGFMILWARSRYWILDSLGSSSHRGTVHVYLSPILLIRLLMELFYEKQAEHMQGTRDSQTSRLKWHEIAMLDQEAVLAMYVFFGIFFGLIVALIVTIFTQKKSQNRHF